MPDKVVETPYPLIDADPHFNRVVRYMRPSDYAVWAGATAAFPSALYFWGKLAYLSLIHSSKLFLSEMADPTKARLRPALRLGGVFGFIGGFLLAYQRSSCESTLSPPPHGDHADAQCSPSKSAFGGGQKTSMRKKRISQS
jgi:hypothetical protein